MSNKINRILLTGPPGIGKTTVIQSVCNLLKTKSTPVTGFYTKEVKNSFGSRIGFNVVTIDGKTGILARIKDSPECLNRSIEYTRKVGNYAVFVDEFESLVLPLFELENKDVIFIIDEIGKMELFSTSFTKAVQELFNTQNIKIIATIPSVKNLPIINKLRTTPSTITIMVHRSNRNSVPTEIINFLNVK